jgi:hypothetical protein
MPTSISPPPERDFPPGQQARRRHQLVSIAQSDGVPAKRRLWVPIAAAASVVALVAGAMVAVQALRPDGTPQVAGGETATTTATTTASAKAKQPAKPQIARLVTHDITGAALQQFYDECVQNDRELNEEPTPIAFRNFERPLFAFSIEFPDGPQPPETEATAWLVAAHGDGSTADKRATCVRNRWGNVEARGQLASRAPKGDPYLYQIVDGRSSGAGLFVQPVATVTFQSKAKGGVETYAVVRDGMWFYPAYVPRSTSEEPPRVDGGLIGLLGGLYRYRGYDANGKLVYDSAKDGPFVGDCHTDPAGTEVIHTAGKPDASPETCERTYEWTAP